MKFLSIKRFFSSDYGTTALKKLCVIVFGFASAGLIARYLGPAGRAEYALIANWAAILTVIFNFGISSSYQNSRRVTGLKILPNFVIYSIFLFFALASISSALLFFNAQLAFFVGLLSSVMVLRLHLQTYHMIESLHGDARAVFFGNIFNILCILGITIFFPSLLVWAISALILKELIIALLSLRGICNSLVKSVPHPRQVSAVLYHAFASARAVSKNRITSSLPFFFLTILIVVNYKVDVIFLDALYIDARSIGIFSIGVVMAEYLWVVSDVFKDVQISRTSKGSRSQGVASAMRTALVATLIIYAGFILLGKPFVVVVFGVDYEDSYKIAVFMLLANIFMIPCKILGAYLISNNCIKGYLVAMLVAVATNASLNLLLIPVMGVQGAILASVISYAIPGIAVIRIFALQTGLGVRKVIFPQKGDFYAIKALIERI